MSIERRNPIPPGRYWIDTFDPDIGDFAEWAKNSPQVSVIASELHDDEKPKRQWVLFAVKEPGAVFEATKFGFPTIAGEDVKSSDDTVQKPEVKQPELADLVESAKGVAYLALALVGAIVAAKLVKR